MIVSRMRLLVLLLLIGALAQTWCAVESEVTTSDLTSAPPGDPIRGERIALTCARCHGETGISQTEWIPSLAGMNQGVIYKQLADYRSHRRRPEWYMASVAEALSLQDSADVSAFYASRTRVYQARETTNNSHSLRAGASCRTCHNAQSNDAPELEGQQPEYLEIQMGLFAQKIRTNDRDGVMQEIARKLTPDQIRQMSKTFRGPAR